MLQPIDKHTRMRLQVYRWVRGLRPPYRGATITITHDAESVVFDAGSFARGIQLDPVQRLAGLMIDPAGILRAPRRCKHRDDCFRAGDVSSVAHEG